MKKLFSLSGLVIMIITLFTTGCEKPLDEQILGKWEVTFQTFQYFNVDVLVEEEKDTMDANEQVIEVLEGGTGNTYSYGVLEDEFTWTLDGSMLTVTITGVKADDTMEFETTIKKDKLTLVWTVDAPMKKSEIITKMVMTIIAKRV